MPRPRLRPGCTACTASPEDARVAAMMSPRVCPAFACSTATYSGAVVVEVGVGMQVAWVEKSIHRKAG